MKQLTFHIETLTPMFMAGEEQRKFELRPPSFKGLLRFWWRAYYWGASEAVAPAMTIEKQMAKREGDIFGTASDNGHKSSFSLRLTNRQFTPSTRRFGGEHAFVMRYLAYGATDREYIPEKSRFSLVLSIADGNVEEVIKSLYFLAVSGAVGAKSRNGFGNFTVLNPDVFRLSAPEFFEGFQQQELYPFPNAVFLKQKIVKDSEPPRFSGFSKKMKIFKLKQTYKSAEDCHAQLGEIYKDCKTSLDHPLSCQKRQYIASPITIQKRIGGKWKRFESSFLERHAKPYFLKVVKTAQGFEGYLLYLPSLYCEGLEKDRHGNRIHHDEANKLFRECCGQLNDYLSERMEVYYG